MKLRMKASHSPQKSKGAQLSLLEETPEAVADTSTQGNMMGKQTKRDPSLFEAARQEASNAPNVKNKALAAPKKLSVGGKKETLSKEQMQAAKAP